MYVAVALNRAESQVSAGENAGHRRYSGIRHTATEGAQQLRRTPPDWCPQKLAFTPGLSTPPGWRQMSDMGGI